MKFIQRSLELNALQQYWDDIRSVGFQSVVILAEPGLGKTRLVQEFYKTIQRQQNEPAFWPTWSSSNDSACTLDPGLQSYDVKSLRTLKLPWLWWAVNGSLPDRNKKSAERFAAYVALTQFSPLLQCIQKSNSAKRVLGKLIVNLTIKVGANVLGVGLIQQVAEEIGNFKDLAQDFMEGAGALERKVEMPAAAQEAKVVEAIAQLVRALCGGGSKIPLIIAVDDAHCLDENSIWMIEKFLLECLRNELPVFVLATHWRSKWNESDRSLSSSFHRMLLRVSKHAQTKTHLIQAIRLAPLEGLEALIAESFPALPPEQLSLLAAKSVGNPRISELIIRKLKSRPQLFLNEDPSSRLTETALRKVNTWAPDIQIMTEEWLEEFDNSIIQLLTVCSRIGYSFPRNAALHIASAALPKITMLDLEKAMESAISFGIVGPIVAEPAASGWLSYSGEPEYDCFLKWSRILEDERGVDKIIKTYLIQIIVSGELLVTDEKRILELGWMFLSSEQSWDDEALVGATLYGINLWQYYNNIGTVFNENSDWQRLQRTIVEKAEILRERLPLNQLYLLCEVTLNQKKPNQWLALELNNAALKRLASSEENARWERFFLEQRMVVCADRREQLVAYYVSRCDRLLDNCDWLIGGWDSLGLIDSLSVAEFFDLLCPFTNPAARRAPAVRSMLIPISKDFFKEVTVTAHVFITKQLRAKKQRELEVDLYLPICIFSGALAYLALTYRAMGHASYFKADSLLDVALRTLERVQLSTMPDNHSELAIFVAAAWHDASRFVSPEDSHRWVKTEQYVERTVMEFWGGLDKRAGDGAFSLIYGVKHLPRLMDRMAGYFWPEASKCCREQIEGTWYADSELLEIVSRYSDYIATALEVRGTIEIQRLKLLADIVIGLRWTNCASQYIRSWRWIEPDNLVCKIGCKPQEIEVLVNEFETRLHADKCKILEIALSRFSAKKIEEAYKRAENCNWDGTRPGFFWWGWDEEREVGYQQRELEWWEEELE